MTLGQSKENNDSQVFSFYNINITGFKEFHKNPVYYKIQ